ncbi:MAG: ATP-binding cassette domain-containing protein [Bacteroidaceae bacterium]|nr:ATP-binding cassette domain-containing protein [Bacteroidaceae bacterium]
MLKIDNLTFGYSRKKLNYEDFSLSFPKGGIYGLLGQNGVGKTTLFYLIMGMLTPKKGEVAYKGVNTLDAKPDLLSEMFIVPEEFDLPPVKIQTFAKHLSRFYPRFSNEEFLHCLSEFSLSPDESITKLSMGMRKKVYISLALATNTNLLLMDEPTNGLDIMSKTKFRQLVSSYASDERIIIISTHQVKEVENLLDHVMIIEPNRVVVDASLADIADKFSFAEVGQNELPENCLYSEPSVGGFSVVAENQTGNPSLVDLELLYKAAIMNSEQVNNILNQNQ